MLERVNIKTISKLSGFSVSTVSKALNEKEDISKNTKSIIRQIAKKHNYKPNSRAITFRCKRSNIIAVIAPSIESIFFSSVISKIRTIAFNNGYHMLIFESFYCKKQEFTYLKEISEGISDGIILIKNLNEGEKLPEISFSHLEDTLPTMIMSFNESDNHSFNDSILKKSFVKFIKKI